MRKNVHVDKHSLCTQHGRGSQPLSNHTTSIQFHFKNKQKQKSFYYYYNIVGISGLRSGFSYFSILNKNNNNAEQPYRALP